MQIQQDRIVHNWRRREAEQEYPRYEAIRESFRLSAEFQRFLSDENVGKITPN